MKRRILTYGTFDIFHQGHYNILKRAAQLGDELYVGVSTDSFNKIKGKKSRQPYEERLKEIESLDFVTKVFAEENWDQKLSDIQKYNIDIFTMGSDWEGKFDELNKYCDIVILDRTEGISSSYLKEKILEINLVTYNPNIEYFEKAIDSLKMIEKYPFIKLKVWDNGSNLFDIKKALKEIINFNNVSFEKIKVNNGKAPVIFNIYKNTNADYVFIMNDDDIIDIDKLASNFNYVLSKKPDVSIFNYNYLNDKNNKTRLKKIIKGNSREIKEIPRYTWTIDLNCIYNVKFIKRNKFNFSNKINNFEDLYVNMLFFSKTNKIMYINDYFYNYRIKRRDKGNISSFSSIRKNSDNLKIIYNEIKYIEKKYNKKNIKWRMFLVKLVNIIT